MKMKMKIVENGDETCETVENLGQHISTNLKEDIENKNEDEKGENESCENKHGKNENEDSKDKNEYGENNDDDLENQSEDGENERQKKFVNGNADASLTEPSKAN